MKRSIFLRGLQISFEERIARAVEWITNSKHLVAFTGAGISTDSGLPDFRGVWSSETDETTRYSALSKNMNNIKPNEGHRALVKLQEMNILKFLISQNLDNLHLTSGIREDLIAEIHGNLDLARCLECGKKYKKTWDRPSKCTCGGKIKSFVIKYGDELPKQELDLSFNHSKQADVFIVIGSSLTTQPAGNLPRIAKSNGAKVIIINRGETTLDQIADLRFNEDSGTVMTAIVKEIEKIKEKE